MKKFISLATSSVLLISLAGCSGMTKQDIGVVTGGALGGALGSQFGSGSGKILAVVGGTILGAVLGGAIGHSMDKVDQMQMNQTLEAGHANQTTSWHNPDSGNTYYVTPTKTYYHNDQPCRDFTTKAIIGGKTQTVYGQACRMADGTWKMQS